jgi:[ribosomal protein S18]-alanine N-acetyltransferase
MNSLSMLVRAACRGDLEAILDIEQSCRTVTWTPAAFENELLQQNNINLVAHMPSGGLCGFVFALVAAGELEITTIAVQPEFRRQGIGSLLLGAAADAAFLCKASMIHLEVRSKNRPAFNLYCKLGFETRRIRKKYYSDDGDDAIVMSRPLPMVS